MPVDDGLKQKILDQFKEALESGEIEKMIHNIIREHQHVPAMFIVFPDEMRLLTKATEVLKKFDNVSGNVRTNVIKALERVWDQATMLSEADVEIIHNSLSLGEKEDKDRRASAEHWLAKCY